MIIVNGGVEGVDTTGLGVVSITSSREALEKKIVNESKNFT